MLILAAGGHTSTMGQQHDVSAQHSIMLSPLCTAKRTDVASQVCAAQSADQTLMQQVGDSCVNGPLASKAASASFGASHPDTVTTEAPSSSKYPDTKLYQFADIELAHGH